MPKNNTPPRSPELESDAFFDEGDVIEEIDLGALEEDDDAGMDIQSIASDEIVDHRKPPERDDALTIFLNHTESVMSCAFHPTKPNIAVTGGMDDVAFVWEVVTEGAEDRVSVKLLAESHDSKETVDCVKFSYEGKYLATVDLVGGVNIFNGETFDHILTVHGDDEFMFFNWHPSAPVFILGTTSMVTMYSVPKLDTKYLSTSSPTSHRCGQIFPDGKRLAVGLDIGVLRIYDLKSGTAVKTIKPFQGNPEDVVVLDIQKDNGAVLCGCSLGAIFVANPDSGKFSFYPCPNGEGEFVESIAFATAEGGHSWAASAHSSGCLRVWDSSRQQLRHEYSFNSGITKMLWHPKELIIFTSNCLSSIHMFDARSGTVLKEFLGHCDTCLSLDLSLNFSLGPAILTTSDDQSARIFLINEEQSS